RANGTGIHQAPPAVDTGAAAEPGPAEPRLNESMLGRSPVIAALMSTREVAVVDATTPDELGSALPPPHHCQAAGLSPLFSADDFLGLVTVELDRTPTHDLRSDARLAERLAGLADQAVTALQNAALVEQVGDQAWHDSLTGLPNRRLLADRVEQELG